MAISSPAAGTAPTLEWPYNHSLAIIFGTIGRDTSVAKNRHDGLSTTSTMIDALKAIE